MDIETRIPKWEGKGIWGYNIKEPPNKSNTNGEFWNQKGIQSQPYLGFDEDIPVFFPFPPFALEK